MQVNGEPAIPGVALKVGINGIALSPDGQRLYWSITTGDAVYSVETRHLRDGKLRDKFEVAVDISEDDLRERALGSDAVKRAIGEKTVANVIVRAPKLVNIATK